MATAVTASAELDQARCAGCGKHETNRCTYRSSERGGCGLKSCGKAASPRTATMYKF